MPTPTIRSTFKSFRLSEWAMPVKSRSWGLAAAVLEVVKRATNYRLGVRPAHRAWEHAVGVR